MINTKAEPRTQQIDFENDDEVDQALGAAIINALREHKRKGQSVVSWKDGKVVTVAPEDIPVDLTDKAA